METVITVFTGSAHSPARTMQLDQTGVRNSVGHRTVQSASKLVLTAVVLIFLLYLVSLLPGMDRVIPTTSLTFATVVGVIVTVAIVGLLLHLASGLAALTAMVLAGPDAIVEHVASVVHWVVVLAAVLVAHRGIAPAAAPLLDGSMWVYDLAFFLVAVPPLVIIAVRLYYSLDPAAELVADRIAGEPSTD